MVGFAVSGSQRVIEPAALSALRLPAIRDAVFRIRAEASATCQLAADVELDDPLSEATTVRLRLEPAKGDSAPTRLTSAPIIDAVPSKGAASLLHRSPCFTSPHWLQFEVRGPTGSAFTKVRRVRSPTWLPEVIQGRAGPSPGALPPSQSLVLQLWALPAPVTRVHECRARLELCERACEVDQLDACALDGRYALEKKEPGRAVSRLDGPCAGGDVEACTLLLWAVVDKRPKGLRSNPEAVVAPWCEAGVARACSALDPKAWLKTLKALQQQCGRVPSSCGALAKHLLAGPALDRDVAAAFVNLKKLCAAGDEGACTQSASESLRLETVDPVTVMPKISRGCAKRNAEACRLEAMNFANGYTQPRTGLGAENALETACRLGSAAACEMTYRP